MSRPLVTPVEPEPDPEPPVLIIFNEKSGPAQVLDLVSVRHSFTESEVWATTDEQGRPAWLLVLTCETATPNELFDLIGSRLPDYIQARRFPPSRLAQVRVQGELVS